MASGAGAESKAVLFHPLGKRGDEIFEWFFPTRKAFLRTMIPARTTRETGPDDDFGRRAMARLQRLHPRPQHVRSFAQTLAGRAAWKGWWGDTPPCCAPTFILTHTIYAAADRNAGLHDLSFRLRRRRRGPAEGAPRRPAREGPLKIGGGVETVRQYIQAGHVDEIHLAMASSRDRPIGEAVFSGGLDLPRPGVSDGGKA